MKRALLLLFFLLLLSQPTRAQNVRIGVLGHYHPLEITLTATREEAVVVTARENAIILEPGSHQGMIEIRVSGDSLLLRYGGQIIRASEIHAGGRDDHATAFVLEIPGRISRTYRGTLDVKAVNGGVAPIVTMDLETAVSSAVQAESSPNTSQEALKAQAVVTRSYFVAGRGRHHDFDFCDLTHCQSLREPPHPESPAAVAVRATRGLVITYQEKTIATMFTRSCGGHTRTPAELGIPSNGYPYFAVVCDYCDRNPSRWSRRISQQDAERLFGQGEAGRLSIDRRLGWNTVPSNNFTAQPADGNVLLDGVGQGHGIGLCQRGAKAMGEGGANFREILNHYFPNTRVTSLVQSQTP
ncbi:MAG: SpoIID/LytB domain-containing protein [Terriglobia bacterium]